MRFSALIALALLPLAAACGDSVQRPGPTATSAPPSSVTVPGPTLLSTPLDTIAQYANPAFKVRLRYPARWVPEPRSWYDACDDGIAEVYRDPRGREYGFFQISAAGAPLLDLDELAQTLAGHKLRPFGATPQVAALTVDGRDARLILPDEAAPPPEPLAELIVPYSSPIVLASPPPGEPQDSYNYLVLSVHEDFVRTIVGTVKLNEPPTGSEVFLFCGSPTPPPSP